MRFELLEPLRGIAALWVLLYHFTFGEAFRTRFPLLHAWCKLGHVGVPMFFVLSGYCVAAAGRSAARSGTPCRFLFRRMKRIYPTYWLSLPAIAAVPFLIAGLSAAKGHPYQAPTAERAGQGFLAYDAGAWLRVASLTQVFAAPDPAARPHAEGAWLSSKFTALNAVYWTLAIEVQFYLMVALAVACGTRWFWPLLSLATVAGLASRWWPGADAHGHFLPYWPMFACGAALCWLRERGLGMPWAGRTAVFGAAAAWVAFAAGTAWLAHAGWTTVHLPFAVAFAALLFLLQPADRAFAAARACRWGYLWRGLSFLGAMSYSLYLLHGRLYLIAEQWARQAFPADSLGCDAIAVPLTVALCVPFYFLCERPFVAGRGAPPPAPEGSAHAGR